MAATGSHRRRVLAVAPLVLVALAGCGRDDEPVTVPTGPTVTATPTVDPIGLARDYPTAPQEYAEVTVGAWAAPDPVRLAELTTADVHTEIIELPGPPDLTWAFVACDTDTDRSGCAFYNRDGDHLVLTIDHALLGEAGATTAMRFEAIRYPADVLAYVETFVTAWEHGNQARMSWLAVPAALEGYAALPPPAPAAEISYRTGDSAGVATEVLVTIADPQGSTEVTLSVNTSLLGEPHAIRAATLAAE